MKFFRQHRPNGHLPGVTADFSPRRRRVDCARSKLRALFSLFSLRASPEESDLLGYTRS